LLDLGGSGFFVVVGSGFVLVLGGSGFLVVVVVILLVVGSGTPGVVRLMLSVHPLLVQVIM
jgi:hypothetical protein